MIPQFLCTAAAVPAVVLGVWLLRIEDAPLSVQGMQVLVTVAAMAVQVVVVRLRTLDSLTDSQWPAVFLAASLFMPLIAETGSPARWLVLGSIRLYVAPIALPLVLFLLAGASHTPAILAASVTIVAIALVLQPDASQLTAFSLGMLVLLGPAELPRAVRLGLCGILLGSVVVAWRTPDPLAPVRYVEGVFTVASEASPLALLAAVVSAALPVAAFLWAARVSRSLATCAVAVYYGVLFALAPLQVTPVPLLGFGAGPILGYFLVAGVVSHPGRAMSNGPITASRRRRARS